MLVMSGQGISVRDWRNAGERFLAASPMTAILQNDSILQYVVVQKLVQRQAIQPTPDAFCRPTMSSRKSSSGRVDNLSAFEDALSASRVRAALHRCARDQINVAPNNLAQFALHLRKGD